MFISSWNNSYRSMWDLQVTCFISQLSISASQWVKQTAVVSEVDAEPYCRLTLLLLSCEFFADNSACLSAPQLFYVSTLTVSHLYVWWSYSTDPRPASHDSSPPLSHLDTPENTLPISHMLSQSGEAVVQRHWEVISSLCFSVFIYPQYY